MQKLLVVLFAAIFFLFGPAVLADECQGTHTPAQHGQKTSDAKCPAEGHEVVKTVADASLTGKIVCNHCDLHRADKCQKVLQTADKKVYQFCPSSVKAEQLKELSGKEVKVSGTIKELKDADSVVEVKSISSIS